MPRQTRLNLAGVVQHVIQRGNDRKPCFFADRDRIQYLHDLKEGALKLECRVHAYVLMTNHVHLLITPEVPGAVSRLMQDLGRRYVRAVNDRYGRTGTLWEGRYRACLVDSEHYLLACQRYIELNPVRAAMVTDPANCHWSSYRANALGDANPLVKPHEAYLSLGRTDPERQRAYRALVATALAEDDLAAIRAYTQRQHALGSTRFQDTVEAMLNRRVRPGRNGRPPKPTPDAESETVL